LFAYFEKLEKGCLIGCRHVLCLDITFSKAFFEVNSLVSIGVNNNTQMFLFTQVVVEEGNNDRYGFS